MTRSLRVWTGLAAIHCLLVLFGASGIRLQERGWLGELITYYSCLTGAERGFGFFAPEVSPEARVFFEGGQGTEIHWREDLVEGATDEADLRISNVAGKYWQYLEGQNTVLRRSVGASLASEFFRRRPEARKVKVSLEIFQFTSMPEYRQGKRQSWKRMYEANFSR